MECGTAKKKIVGIEDSRRTDGGEKFTEEEVTETAFHKTCIIRRGALDRSDSERLEEVNAVARAVTWGEEEAETGKLLSFLDLVNQDTTEYPGKNSTA